MSRVIYSLIGKGADQNPVDRFTVDSVSGLVKVNSILDREEIANYTVSRIEGASMKKMMMIIKNRL